ncbi:hypothetical protein J3L16_03860 [Alteromonas sp. 5E99-2]|uniref:hypothetical protein n=1 Tax=Alteromonas sp. 5E99-2 TaxID=2817683 RepID=UPI001A99DC75|nr:hypothetical protein [Alteromonas sp. 5E99-2]MBO1254823.1 hypothetical protein [Alteromonas sp. 5E99-2]
MNDFQPNYSTYSYFELKEALESIDKSLFSERANQIQAELDKRTSKSQMVGDHAEQIKATDNKLKTPNILTKTDSKIVHFIIRVWCMILFYLPAVELYEIITVGTTYARRHGTITFDSDPFIFSIEVVKSLIFAVLLVLGFFKNPMMLGKKNEPKA